jgi:hypothetical protein
MYTIEHSLSFIGSKRMMLGKSMWDKLKCYWELLEEQIWETIKNFMITNWELSGNTNENNKSPKNPTLLLLPPPPQKKFGSIGCMLQIFIDKT